MIHDPEVVVFDEPTSGLDVITAENIIKLIRDCKNEGKTVIFSSHIMSEVDLLCDDIAIIHKGNLLYNGTMNDFRKNMEAPNLTAEFIRIVKPGGFICYTNRTDKLDQFTEVEQQLETDKQWTLVEKLGPLPYLPNHPEFADQIKVFIYFYQRTAN